jgi:hydroxymethylglutaryl-CoA lyase
MNATVNGQRSTVNLIECPRDAMQGWKNFIATADKIRYINSLLQVGFDTLDFGSFVSPKAIPQMADTPEVLAGLDLSGNRSQLLAIVANLRGAEEALAFDAIQYLGFPLSISETFQQRNTNASINDALKRIADIRKLCLSKNRQLVVYLSMAFGNPYGDAYSEEIVFEKARQLVQEGIGIISLADTVGVAGAEGIRSITSFLVRELPQSTIGVHLHSTAANWKDKLGAAYDAGCRRFDGALKGIGGCPMAADVLVGNMNTEWLLSFFDEQGIPQHYNREALLRSLQIAGEIFV